MHPEQGTDEIFVGNGVAVPASCADLKSIRLGEVAYDVEGKRLPPGLLLRPIFVGRAELGEYDRIKMDRLRRIRRGEEAEHD